MVKNYCSVLASSVYPLTVFQSEEVRKVEVQCKGRNRGQEPVKVLATITARLTIHCTGALLFEGY